MYAKLATGQISLFGPPAYAAEMRRTLSRVARRLSPPATMQDVQDFARAINATVQRDPMNRRGWIVRTAEGSWLARFRTPREGMRELARVFDADRVYDDPAPLRVHPCCHVRREPQ